MGFEVTVSNNSTTVRVSKWREFKVYGVRVVPPISPGDGFVKLTGDVLRVDDSHPRQSQASRIRLAVSTLGEALDDEGTLGTMLACTLDQPRWRQIWPENDVLRNSIHDLIENCAEALVNPDRAAQHMGATAIWRSDNVW